MSNSPSSFDVFMTEFEKIPSENLLKFWNDLLKLTQYAQKDNYENFVIGR